MKNKSLLKSAAFLLLSLFVNLSSAYSQTVCTASATGSWTNPAVWSCGSVPSCGDSIVILSGVTVSNTTQQDYSGCAQPMKLTIFGNLLFSTGFKLKLPCGSQVSVAGGGSITAGGGGGASNYIQICGVTVWDASDGTYEGPACLPPTPCNATVLPVELSSFTATVNGSVIGLNWVTMGEKNSSHFDIERCTDAINFEKISSVPSKSYHGNSNIKLEYSFSDESPIENNSYYRLKQVDRDGTFSYSGIISVINIKSNEIKFTIYPNPNKGEFTADISGVENNHNVTLLLHDIQGRLVYKSNFFIQDAASSKFNIMPEHKLENGIYTCSLLVEEVSFSVKVVVN